ISFEAINHSGRQELARESELSSRAKTHCFDERRFSALFCAHPLRWKIIRAKLHASAERRLNMPLALGTRIATPCNDEQLHTTRAAGPRTCAEGSGSLQPQLRGHRAPAPWVDQARTGRRRQRAPEDGARPRDSPHGSGEASRLRSRNED